MSATTREPITFIAASEKAVSYFKNGGTDFAIIRDELVASGLDKPDAIQIAVAARDSVNSLPLLDANKKLNDIPNPPTAEDIAAKYIDLGCYVYFLPRPDKGCKIPEWEKKATRDLPTAKQIIAGRQYLNVMLVGKQDGCWVLDFDDVSVLEEYEKLHGEIPTRRHKTPSGGLHLLFRPSQAAWEMGNLEEHDEQKGELWSSRINNRYALAPGSVTHPDNDPEKPLVFYTALNQLPPIEAPPSLIEFLKKRAGRTVVRREIDTSTSGAKIPHGSHDTTLFKIACSLRERPGLEEEGIYNLLVEICEKRCENYGSDYKDMCRNKAHQACKKYPPGTDSRLIINQPVLTSASSRASSMSAAVPSEEVETQLMPDNPYPVFPDWVMNGTSLYENFAKPICEHNSRIPYFLWLTANQLLLNYLGPKLKLEGFGGDVPFRGAIYSVIIGEKGKTHKSSSVNDAMTYLGYCNILRHAGVDLKNADGKTIVFTVGSTEGLGIEAQRMHCRNMVLFYDELSKLVAKASIESSSMSSDLLTMYEAGKFGNGIKATKSNFSFEPDTYCTTIIALTTNTKFAPLWAKMTGTDTGMDDRFFFVLQPEKLPTALLQKPVNTVVGATETTKRIEKALQQGRFKYEIDNHHGLQKLVKLDARYANRAQRWALGLAVDLGLDEIDSDSMDRACAIIEYEIAVKKYLRTYEATTREGQIQGEIRSLLERNRGRLSKYELKRRAHYERHGTSLWYGSYRGLISHQVIREIGSGAPGDPVMVQLMEVIEQEE